LRPIATARLHKCSIRCCLRWLPNPAATRCFSSRSIPLLEPAGRSTGGEGLGRHAVFFLFPSIGSAASTPLSSSVIAWAACDLADAGCLRLGAEVGQDPGGSGFTPRLELEAWFKVDDELERFRIVASQAADLVCELGQCSGSGQLDREDPVPARRPAEGASMWPACRDPDRDPRTLHRLRLELAVPARGQSVEPGVESMRPFARIDHLAEPLKLAVSIAAEADPKDQPSPAQAANEPIFDTKKEDVRPLLRWLE
jgi:hypothetical protein